MGPLDYSMIISKLVSDRAHLGFGREVDIDK